jgi:hypothetical protein
VADRKLRSGPDVVNAFLAAILGDTELDDGVAGAIIRLQREGKLTQTRLLQELEALRKVPRGNG